MKTKINLGARTLATSQEIIKLEAQENYTLIYFTNGQKLLSSTTLGVLEDRLKVHSFFRVNRSVMINLAYLNKFRVLKSNSEEENSDAKGEKVLVSRRRWAEFQERVSYTKT